MHMRIEDVYTDRLVKVEKTRNSDKGINQHRDKKVWVRSFEMISSKLNRMRTFVPFFRGE